MSRFAALALAAEQPARMTILHPATAEPLRDDEGNPAWIDLLSQDSDAAQRITRAAINRRLSSRNRKLSAEEIRREETEVLAGITKGWRLLSLRGEPLDIECTPAAAAELYDMPALAWLREQVGSFVADRGNFLAG